MVATTDAVVVLEAVKAGIEGPDPEAARPMAGIEFVHV
jgi:hypothetical protein